MFVWIVLNKYLLNVNIYLFDTKTINLNIIFLLRKYLFIVNKYLFNTIQRNMYQDLINCLSVYYNVCVGRDSVKFMRINFSKQNKLK